MSDDKPSAKVDGTKVAGRGSKANYIDLATNETYWISGPRKDGQDTLYPGLVEIDDDVKSTGAMYAASQSAATAAFAAPLLTLRDLYLIVGRLSFGSISLFGRSIVGRDIGLTADIVGVRGSDASKPGMVFLAGEQSRRRPTFGHEVSQVRGKYAASGERIVARNFHNVRGCSRADSTSERPARQDMRWDTAASDAHRSTPCCTSWFSRHAQTLIAELRDADGCGLPRCVDRELVGSPTASRACVARRATTRSSSRSRASSAASARRAPRDAWPTPRLTSSIACCRRHRIGNGCCPYPSRCACGSHAIRRGRVGWAVSSCARSPRDSAAPPARGASPHR